MTALLAALVLVAPPGTAPVPAAPPGQAAAEGNGQGRAARPPALPDIAVIGDLVGVYDGRDAAAESMRDPWLVSPAGEVKPLLREVEVALRAALDPSARADVFLSFGPAGADVEEAFLTTQGLPARLQLRAGKLRSPFGRQNPLHRHAWDFADAPLVLSRLLGPNGLSGAGADLAWLAPLPWLAELHVAWQEVRAPFETTGRSAGLARLRQGFELAEGTTLGLGLSGAADLARMGGARVLSGADAALELRSPRAGTVTLQAEAVARNLGAAGGGDEWGLYGQAVWRPGPRWLAGVRYDDSAASGGGRERRWSVLAGFLPSAYQRLRAQVAWDRLPGGRTGLEVVVHLEFAMGSLGEHALGPPAAP